MNKWQYFEPNFECDYYNKELLVNSPWSGHRNFAYDFIAFYKPKTIVELGSYYGCSSFAFLQAIKDKKLDTEFFAIDTWGGDTFTVNDYKEDIYNHFKSICEQCYKDTNVTMLKMTFDQAINKFNDESIDLLHIDGSHNYDDVKHDFFTWKNKVKQDGIILFHDVSKDRLFNKEMGSHVFWKEVVNEYPFTLEFDHSFGLGILFKSEEKFIEFKKNVNMHHYQRLNNEMDVNRKDELRKNYFKILDLSRYIEDLKKQCDVMKNHLDKYSVDIKAKEDYISDLERQKKDILNIIDEYNKTVKGKDDYIKELEEKESLLITDYEKMICGKDSYIKELEYDRESLNNIVIEYKANVEGKDRYIKELEHDRESLNNIIVNYKENVEGKDNYIKELEEKENLLKADYERTICGKDSYIKELEFDRNELNTIIKDYEANIKGKDDYISELLEKEDKSQNFIENYDNDENE